MILDIENSQSTVFSFDTITYKSSLTPQKMYKKTNAIFSMYGKNGIIPWLFFEFSLRPFEVVEVEWKSAS